ncbi:MAG: GNAT family N-acetyltransferase [Anaerolineales bacterium]
MPIIRPATPADYPQWLALRLALWDDNTEAEMLAEMHALLTDPEQAVFLAEENGALIGFAEVSLRKYADGCDSSPVGYLEGWYVAPEHRRSGIGGALVRAGEDWARERGCREMASDTWLENEISILAHLQLGYIEAERLVHFTKYL